MPVTTLVCPHCEKTVEIQASSVTRSRPCPECGQVVMLQMAEKSTKTKRRALLMGQNEPPTPVSLPRPEMTPSHEPQPLPGDAFDRMRMDPEIQQFRKRLLIGAGAVGLIVVVLVILSILRPPLPPKRPAAATQAPSGEQAPTTPAAMITPADVLPPVTSGNLVFRPPGSSDLKTATASGGGGDSNASLAKLAAGEEVLGRFLRAKDWRERALLVRDRLRVAPLMSIYYSKNADGPMEFDSLVEADEAGARFTEHVVVFEGGGRRLATVEHGPSGALVDWESFVGAGDMAWSDFLDAKKVSPTLFRVLVSPAGHFENQFGNPSELQCYSLRTISEPGAKVIYGYADKRSPLVKELDFLLEQSSDATVPVILRLKFPPDAPVDFQVWIHQVVQSGWVTQ